MSDDQTTATDPRLRVAELDTAKSAVLAAAITWWGDQIATVDMPAGPERDLAAACDEYMNLLQVKVSDAGLADSPAGRLLDSMVTRAAQPDPTVLASVTRGDCGGA